MHSNLKVEDFQEHPEISRYCSRIIKFTLPETNIAPENRVSQKETSIPTIHSQGRYVSFREGKSSFIQFRSLSVISIPWFMATSTHSCQDKINYNIIHNCWENQLWHECHHNSSHQETGYFTQQVSHLKNGAKTTTRKACFDLCPQESATLSLDTTLELNGQDNNWIQLD